MITMEEKVNVCIQAIAATSETERLNAVKEAQKILAESGAGNPLTESDEPTEKQIRYEIELAMNRCGIPGNLIGYEYIIEAVYMAFKDRSTVYAITSVMYPGLAKTFNTTPSRVERAIRHAIESTYQRGNMDALEEYIGCSSSFKGKATNREFIVNLYRKIRHKIYGTK